jgi:hypothetical protein
MVKPWDGKERRKESPIPYKEGRREGDVHCPDHALIQENAKEHRVVVCGKIAAIKTDAEKDLAECKARHDADLSCVQSEMNKKADSKELKSVSRLVSIMISLAIIAIGAQAVWLKGDNRELRDAMRADIMDIGSKIQRLNQRVSESVDERVRTDMEQTKHLGEISGKLDTVSWRLTVLEDSQRKAVVK